MNDLRLSRSAERDLRDIGEAGAEQFGVDASRRHLAGFERLFTLLRRHPHAGTPHPRLGPGIRSIAHRPHRLIYRVDGEGVLIVRVLHQRRLEVELGWE